MGSNLMVFVAFIALHYVYGFLREAAVSECSVHYYTIFFAQVISNTAFFLKINSDV